jgi:hypothetical protein
MNSKKIATVLNMIEIAENNLKTAKSLLSQLAGGVPYESNTNQNNVNFSTDEADALEVVEGYFDGESMIGDNGKVYLVPPNYASKTQLIVGDRMKWILTSNREIYKLIAPANRERATGVFVIEDDKYLVIMEKYPNPVQILKASATYAMKNLGLQIGDMVALTIPKDTTPTWGAFNSVVKSQEDGYSNNTDDDQSIYDHSYDVESVDSNVGQEVLNDDNFL